MIMTCSFLLLKSLIPFPLLYNSGPPFCLCMSVLLIYKIIIFLIKFFTYLLERWNEMERKLVVRSGSSLGRSPRYRPGSNALTIWAESRALSNYVSIMLLNKFKDVFELPLYIHPLFFRLSINPIVLYKLLIYFLVCAANVVS